MQKPMGVKPKRFKVNRHKCALRLLIICAVPALIISVAHKMHSDAGVNSFNVPVQISEATPQYTDALPGSLGALHSQPAHDETSVYMRAPLRDDWQLILVNPWNSMPGDYTVELTELMNGEAIDSRAYPDLQQMMDDCRAAGLSPLICSSYRSIEKQTMLFENKISRLMAEGYSYESAKSEAGKVVAVPGTSEHQTALALDIVDLTNQNLDETQEHTGVQQWLMAHSWEYGFVLRYPSGKSDITGIIYEPWHYRYVGREAAEEMTELGICLEEYISLLDGRSDK